jgi:hypothetical protein
MHLVVVKVNVHNADAVVNALQNELAPMISQLPGFVAGYWTVDDPSAMGVVVFDSEDAANVFRDAVEVRRERMPQEVVTLDSVEVRTVVAHR